MEPDHSGGLLLIAIDDIRPNPSQPRRVFDGAALETLAASIRSHGVLQPVLVRPITESGRSHSYELVAGERRWRASKLAGHTTIPAIVQPMEDGASAEVALIENLQREDLNVVERATALRALCTALSLTHGEAAERVGLERSTITNLLRLLELEDRLLQHLSEGRLTSGHGRALLAEPDEQRRLMLADASIKEQWSVRELERRIKQRATPAAAPRVNSPAVVDLEQRLGEQLGTKVAIKTDRSGKKGSLTISFYGLDHFESVIARMGCSDRAE